MSRKSSTNRPLPRSDSLGAMPAFAAAHELSAPCSAGIDDAEPLTTALAAAKSTLLIFGLL